MHREFLGIPSREFPLRISIRESNNPDKIVEALNSARLACNLRSTILPDRLGRMADFGSLSEKVLQLNKRQIFKNSWYEELFALNFEIFYQSSGLKIEENRRQS